MKLAQRFYLFFLPILLLSAVGNAMHAWYDYHERINQFTHFAMSKGLESFKIFSNNPVYSYYFEDISMGFTEDADRDVKDMIILFEDEVKHSRQLFREILHIGLYDKNWNVIAEFYPSQKGNDQKIHPDDKEELIRFNDFFTTDANANTIYSFQLGYKHNMVAPIIKDIDNNGVIKSSEIVGYIHHDNILPLGDIFNSAQEEAWENTLMALMQIAVLSLAFFWIGRSVPRPFEMFTNQVLRLPEEGHAPNFFHTANIHELKVLGDALNRMNQDILRKHKDLIQARDLAEHSERMLRLILDTIPARVFWKDLHGAYLGGNIQFARSAGFETMEGIISLTDHDLCWFPHADHYRSQDMAVITTRKSLLNIEQIQIDCQGKTSWVEMSTVPLLDGNDNVIGVLCASQDVTSRITAQEERDRFFTVSPDVMCVIGSDRRFRRVNRSLQEITRMPETELLATNLVEITHPQDRDIAMRFMERLTLKPNQVIMGDFRISSLWEGQPIVISWSAIAQNNTIYAVGRDVTEQKLIEWKLKLTQTSVEQATDNLFWINPEGKFVYVNSSATHALGYSREELLTRFIADIDTQISLETWQNYWQELVTKKRKHSEGVFKRKDGSTYPVDINAHYLRYQGEEYAISFVRDITLHKKSEKSLQDYAENLETMVQQRTRELAHAERLASLGTFSAGMAHEVNNPNSFIAGNIDFLQHYWDLARPILKDNQGQDKSGRIGAFMDEVGATLTGMRDGSRRISKIVDSLKAYSRGGMESDKVECRVADPIMDAQYLLQHRLKKGFHLTIDVANDLHVICDRQQMGQVFVNLLNNAMDAMETMGENHEKKLHVKAEHLDDHIWIRVSDNGPGIPKEAMGRIFDPFYTSKGKTKGTGLGLSIVQGIIEDHSGQITVFSTAKITEGAEFLIILPDQKTYQKIRKHRKR